MGSALQEPGAPEISHGIPGVPPPAALYISPNEQLVVDSWGYACQLPVFIKLRILRPGGYVDTTVYMHQPSSDRSLVTTYHDLAEGHLLTAMVYAFESGYHRGQCYLNVGLQRGRDAVGVYHHQLIAGYVTTSSALVWPWARLESSVEGPGLIRSVTGADPAAGAEILVTVPPRARWRPHLICVYLQTDATVAGRIVIWHMDDGAIGLWQMYNGLAQAASLLWSHVLSRQGVLRGDGGAGGTHLPMPELVLLAGYRIRTVTQNIAAGDNWGAPQLLVEEWIEP